jgi:DNA processing protein
MITMQPLELAFLTQCAFLNRKRLSYIREHYFSIEELKKDIFKTCFHGTLHISQENCRNLRGVLDTFDTQVFGTYLAKHGIIPIDQTSEYFPFLLKHIPDPPLLLFLTGNKNLLKTECISIVGTRKPSSYGRQVVGSVMGDMHDLTVVSGGAYGIDQLAHEEAMRQGKSTIVVLGMGLMRMHTNIRDNSIFHKHENKVLYISEYFPNFWGSKYTFPERNRIISGLSKAVIVVEAPKRSGSLITANFALEQGRDVISVPGPIFNNQSVGTNELLSCSAHPYSREVINNIYKKTIQLNFEENAVLSQLEEPKYLDELDVDNVLTIVSSLEIHGLITKMSDGRWKKRL